MFSISNFDIFFSIIIICSTLLGLFRGFVRELFVLITWVMAIYCSYVLSPQASFVLGNFASGFTRRIIVGFIIGILILIIGNIISLLITTLIIPAANSFINRILGGIYGFSRGSICVFLLVIFSQDFAKKYDSYHLSVITRISNTIYDDLVKLNYIPSKDLIEQKFYNNLKYIEDI